MSFYYFDDHSEPFYINLGKKRETVTSFRNHLAPAPKSYTFSQEAPNCARHTTVKMEWRDGLAHGKAYWCCPVCVLGADDCPVCKTHLAAAGDGIRSGSVSNS